MSVLTNSHGMCILTATVTCNIYKSPAANCFSQRKKKLPYHIAPHCYSTF